MAYVAKEGHKQLLVVDGNKSQVYDGFLKGSRVIFDSPTTLHTLAIRDNTIYRSN